MCWCYSSHSDEDQDEVSIIQTANFKIKTSWVYCSVVWCPLKSVCSYRVDTTAASPSLHPISCLRACLDRRKSPGKKTDPAAMRPHMATHFSQEVCVCVWGFTLPLLWMWEVRRAQVGRSGLGEEPPAVTCQRRCGDGGGSAGRVSRKHVPSRLFTSFDYLQISAKYEQSFIHRSAVILRKVLVICSVTRSTI